MSTLGDIKVSVATQLGATDGTASVPKRDRSINRARRKFYSERRWSFCFRSATVSISSQLGSLPTQYNKKFDPECLYYYSGNTKYELAKVEWSDIGMYSGTDFCYAINKQSDQIQISRTDVSSVTMDYYQLPADAAIDTTGDATSELAPDIEPLISLSIAYWWLASERNTANFDRFYDLYKEDLAKAVQADVANQPVKQIVTLRRPLGYNSRGYNYPIKGYIGSGR